MPGIKGAKHADRACRHCESVYTPIATNQKYCFDCLGPATETKWGLRYAARNLLFRYEVSWPEWQSLLAEFDGKCWICRTNEATELDHSHETGKPRGALCRDCNTRLYVVEHPTWLDDARDYLRSF